MPSQAQVRLQRRCRRRKKTGHACFLSVCTMKDYKSFYNALRARLGSGKAVAMLDTCATSFVALSYLAFLCTLVAQRPRDLPKAMLVPACGLVFATILRKTINRPRPYETYDIKPLIIKEQRGESCPSRHVFSAAIIAFTVLHYVPKAGCAMLAASLTVAFARVAGGVHYISDTIASFLLAGTWSLLLFL